MTAPSILPLRTSSVAVLLVVVVDGREGARCWRARNRSASRIFTACVPPSWSTTPSRASLDLAAERVAQHDQLHQREDHRHQHQRRASGRTCASRARQWPSSGSWLHPWPLRHGEAVRLHQFVAQLASGVVDEDVVQRRVLHGQRLHAAPSSCTAISTSSVVVRRAVAGQHAVHARALVLHRGHVRQSCAAAAPNPPADARTALRSRSIRARSPSAPPAYPAPPACRDRRWRCDRTAGRLRPCSAS